MASLQRVIFLSVWMMGIFAIWMISDAASVFSGAALQKPAPFQVKVVGSGQPIILIPGLACSGEVWNETVERYQNKYQCHVLTLAGFGGQPPIEGAFLETMRQSISTYI